MAKTSQHRYGCEIPEEFADVRSEWLQLLMEVGYVACGQGRPTQAATIFDGISAVRPKSELPLIGLAMAQMNLGKLTAACDTLVKRAKKLNPENLLVDTMAAMVFRMSGAVDESDAILNAVIEDGSDDCAVELARHLKTEDFAYLRERNRR
ncbi:MAG: hypothetical protein LBI39_01910 [Puniceicoccales bacterium]|jgi:predicted Zn-dependent protease|nr:hypothetical protein [Puniceicoccales bacterium]